jgi:SAM-dependent methyltransferase
MLAPRPGECILDLGCGDGALTEKLAAFGCTVVAVDASPEQVAAARARGLDAHVCRAEALPYAGEFDGVLSNAVLHWVKDQAAALAAVRPALRPGGRIVAELGGSGCVATIRGALHDALRARGHDPTAYDPWFFPWAGVLDEVQERTRPTLYDPAKGWSADYTRLRYRAGRP